MFSTVTGPGFAAVDAVVVRVVLASSSPLPPQAASSAPAAVALEADEAEPPQGLPAADDGLGVVGRDLLQDVVPQRHARTVPERRPGYASR